MCLVRIRQIERSQPLSEHLTSNLVRIIHLRYHHEVACHESIVRVTYASIMTAPRFQRAIKCLHRMNATATSLQCCLPPSSSIMYFRTIYALFFTFAGIVHATAVNHLPGLLRPRSAHTAMPRRALTVKPLQSRTANSRIVGTLFGRQSGCEAGYTPCLGDSESCCPPDCLECGDNAATCCDIGRCYLFTICLFGAHHSPYHQQVHSVLQTRRASQPASVLDHCVLMEAVAPPLRHLRRLQVQPVQVPTMHPSISYLVGPWHSVLA